MSAQSLSAELAAFLNLMDGSTTLGASPRLTTEADPPDVRTDLAPLAYCRSLDAIDEEDGACFDLSELDTHSDAFLIYSRRLERYVKQCLVASRPPTSQQSILWALAADTVWEKVQWLQEKKKELRPDVSPHDLHLSAQEISQAGAGMAVIPLDTVEHMQNSQFEENWPRNKDFFIALTGLYPTNYQAEEIGEWRCRRFIEARVISTLAKTFFERQNQHTSLIFLSTCGHMALGKVS